VPVNSRLWNQIVSKCSWFDDCIKESLDLEDLINGLHLICASICSLSTSMVVNVWDRAGFL
jgi:hypothetical protein